MVQLILNHLRLEAMQIPIEETRPDNMYARLAHYLEHQIELERLRRHDPELSARTFFFPLWGAREREVFHADARAHASA